MGSTIHTVVDKICSECPFQQGTKGLSYWLSGDETYYIVTGIRSATDSTDIFIPSFYDSKPVTEIGDRAFDHCGKLTIYCEAESKPSSWNWNSWNPSNRPVVWGYKG